MPPAPPPSSDAARFQAQVETTRTAPLTTLERIAQRRAQLERELLDLTAIRRGHELALNLHTLH